MEEKYDIFISYRREGGLTTADISKSGKWFGKAAAQDNFISSPGDVRQERTIAE